MNTGNIDFFPPMIIQYRILGEVEKPYSYLSLLGNLEGRRRRHYLIFLLSGVHYKSGTRTIHKKTAIPNIELPKKRRSNVISDL